MDLKSYLDQKVEEYNNPSFIELDPVSIPHAYTLQQDIEITGLFAAILAWGQRKTIINKSRELFERMDNAPYDFIRNHSDEDLKSLLGFKHRTFNELDLLYFVSFLQHHYSNSDTLETAFLKTDADEGVSMEAVLISFHQYFFSLEDAPQRTRKHIATPERKSACKRLNMYLRWMVRKDNNGVDFGLWRNMEPSRLICPCDLHVDRIGRRLGLITRKQTDWQTAVELTENLKKLDPSDPVKYDYALFGLGIEERHL
ncbi:MAG: TIGR02757 family protein [Cyclobacteriaceae bacterium]